MTRLCLALLWCGLLATACVPATGPERQVQAAGGAPTVGATPVSVARAAEAITTYCLETRPSFADAPERLRSGGFVQNPQTGTFYHQSLDLSVKLMTIDGSPACSMVFVSRDDRRALALGMALGAQAIVDDGRAKFDIAVSPEGTQVWANIGDGQEFLFRPAGVEAGEPYFRALVRAIPVTKT